MSDKTLDEARLKQWVGKSESATDTLHPAQARLMQTTLNREASIEVGDPLPPLWHWAYFLSGVPLSGLGRDGHPALGQFLPPVALPRRMWAGGRLTFEKPILLGDTITKTSTIKNVSLKSGRSGALCFVTVEHKFTSEDGTAHITEEHDIVYREDSAPDAPKPKPAEPPKGSARSQTITPSSVQLFRYSALTFNSHRIHYDREYCKDVEGYPGLIFHGPLTATLLADMAAQHAPIKTFNFRAVSPLFDTAPFTINNDGEGTYWAETPECGLAMKADVGF
ncbi:MAG: MaoC family dehydratase N-terminal domain-containing protein [Rhizobiaceae bacterium]